LFAEDKKSDMLVVKEVGTEGGGGSVPITAATAEETFAETVEWIE
jgi:hypothetical protein